MNYTETRAENVIRHNEEADTVNTPLYMLFALSTELDGE